MLINQAAGMIASAEKPLIIGGSGISTNACAQVLQKFIKKTGIPFLLSNNGRGALPDNHPLSLWDGGLMAIMTALGQADLVIALGVRFNWVLMYGEILPQAKVIRVDIDPAEIDRNRRSDIGLLGDMELALKALNKRVKRGEHMAWRQSLKEAYTPLVQGEIDSRMSPSEPPHPARLVEQVRQAVGDEAIYIIDGGDTSYYGLTGLCARERSAVIGSAGGLFGCLGTGIPFAIGAKTAKPDKAVVLINGDGSFGFNAMEFNTAIRHDLPFVCVINNDQAWGMIKHGQEMCYGDERITGSELGVVHYEEIVTALGGYGEFVERDEEIIPAVKRALASGKPACVNVMTDPCVVSPYSIILSDGLKMK
jgi:acetolactate synthase-1/2/3 large subunit